MKNIFKFIGIFVLIGILINSVMGAECFINSCQDIRSMVSECPTVYLNKSLYGYAYGQTFCVKMSNQILDLNGYSIEYYRSGWSGNTIVGTLGGEIRNGIIKHTSSIDISSGYTYIFENIVFNHSERFLTVSGDNAILRIKNSFLDCGEFQNGLLVSTLKNSNIIFLNVIARQYVLLNGNNNIVNFTNTVIYGSGSNYIIWNKGINNNTLNIISGALCFALNKDLNSESGILTVNSLYDETFFDTNSSNIIFDGNRLSCNKFEGFNEVTQNNENLFLTCENPDYSTLDTVGLTKYWTIRTGADNGISAKITFKNKTLYNSLNITQNKICFENTLNPNLVICKNAEIENGYFGDIMSQNLVGDFNVTLGSYSDYTGGWFDLLKGGMDLYSKQYISEQYCTPYFTYNSLIDWISPYSYCDNGGLKYELLDSEIMSGTYNQYLVLKTNNESCILKIKLNTAIMNGDLIYNNIDIGKTDLSPFKRVTDNQQINIPSQISTKITHINITNNESLNNSNLCVTFYDYNTNNLKYDTIIIHIVENMSSYYDITFNNSKKIASCEAVKNISGSYAFCEMCFNISANNFYAYFTEFINDGDNQDDIFYGGSFGTDLNGNINKSYRVYQDNNGDNTSRDVNYTSGWYYSYSVNQTYYYYEETANSNYDLITMLMIIMIIAFIGIGVFSVLSKNIKQKQ